MKKLKQLIMSIMIKLPNKLREFVLYFRGLFYMNKLVKLLNHRVYFEKQYIVLNEKVGIKNDDFRVWYKSFFKYTMTSPKNLDIAEEFFCCNLNKLTNKILSIKDEDILLICVVKNDLKRIKMLFNHYRGLGITKFIMLDNNSDDGTLEWMLKQADAEVFKTETEYSTNKRQAWINRLISFYGYNKWYLIVDSDELFVYEDYENTKINEMIIRLKQNQITRAKSLLIDMYSANKLFDDSEEDEYIIPQKYKYFDSNNYYEKENLYFSCIIGGVRARTFGKDDPTFRPYLTKYPLIYFVKNDIQCNSHYSFPYYKNFNSPCIGGLLHYKFLGKDLEKYKIIAKKGNYQKGSKEYKKYIDIYNNNNEYKLIYEHTKRFDNSLVLREINVMEILNEK